jgi:hypothetical protein
MFLIYHLSDSSHTETGPFLDLSLGTRALDVCQYTIDSTQGQSDLTRRIPIVGLSGAARSFGKRLEEFSGMKAGVVSRQALFSGDVK